MDKSPEGRALRPWIGPGDVPATASVELSSMAGYEEARAIPDAELPGARAEAEARHATAPCEPEAAR